MVETLTRLEAGVLEERTQSGKASSEKGVRVMKFTVVFTTNTGLSKTVEAEALWHYHAAEHALRDHSGIKRKWRVIPGRKLSGEQWEFKAHAGQYNTTACKWTYTATVIVAEKEIGNDRKDT